MLKSNGNYIKITLYKIKICSETNIKSFTIKMDLGKQSQETEKIQNREVDLGGKSYFFDYSNNYTNLEISAVSRTFLIFDSQIAKVSIPLNTNKFDDKREWFYLKNSNENLICILCSIYCESKSDKSLYVENNLSCLISPQNKNDISYDVLRNNQYMNRTLNNPNMTYSNVQNILNNINNYSLEDNGKHMKTKNYENTVIYNDNCKSPDMSTITNNNLFSPYSNRGEIERGGNIFSNPQSTNFNQTINVSNMKLNELNFLSIDSILDENFENIEDQEQIKKLKIKFCQLREEQDKLKKISQEVFKNKEKIKQNEKILFKEKEKLEHHIRIFKSQKTDLENKNTILNQNFSKLQANLNKFQQEKELFNFEKKFVLNLNLMLGVGKNLSNLNFPEEKINEVNQKLSINNLTLPNTTGLTNITNSSGSLKINLPNTENQTKRYQSHSSTNSMSFKKEVVLENPQNFNISQEKRKPVSKERTKIQLDKEKLLKNVNSSSSNSDNTFNSVNLNDNSVVNKTFNNNFNNSQISKFYTPTAQIDLRRGSSNGSLGHSQNINIEITSPKAQKTIQPENKLLDSLDNMTLLYPSKQTIQVSEKKIQTGKRNGSDELKGNKRRLIHKNTFNNQANNLTNNVNPFAVNNISLSKDNHRKSMLTNTKNFSEKVISLKKDISPLNINLINSQSSTSNVTNKIKLSSAKKMKI